MEYFEVCSEDGSYAGTNAPRDVVHSQGLWHKTAHVWIYNSLGEILFQKRAIHKDSHPGLWDVSAAGHLQIGEPPETAAVREVWEELGLDIDVDELIYFDNKNFTLISQGGRFIDREVTWVYLYRYEGGVVSLNPDEQEVSGLMLMETTRVKKMLEDPQWRKQFVPHRPEYYSAIIDAVKNLTSGCHQQESGL
ncbi:MAG: NUDIX hydrolase [Spirochaetota bacterium]